jgi:hypothetical protein
MTPAQEMEFFVISAPIKLAAGVASYVHRVPGQASDEILGVTSRSMGRMRTTSASIRRPTGVEVVAGEHLFLSVADGISFRLPEGSFHVASFHKSGATFVHVFYLGFEESTAEKEVTDQEEQAAVAENEITTEEATKTTTPRKPRTKKEREEEFEVIPA